MTISSLINECVVFIGAGQAAIQAADTLRTEGFEGRIVIIGDEACLPYQRPQLSKDLLKQEDVTVLPLRAQSFFTENDIELRRGRRVVSVDSTTRTVELDDGQKVDYTQLLFATGSRPRQLSIPGSHSDRVREVRTVDQALRLRADMKPGSEVVIVGGGFIGLEVAAQASSIGANVTLLPGKRDLMSRSISPAMSKWFESLHAATGTKVRCGETAKAFHEADPLAIPGQVVVESDTGAKYAADIIVVGIGSTPNDELARDAGLAVDNGIAVNSYLQASLPNMWSIGDCASFPSSNNLEQVRLESVQNATDQGRLVAQNVLRFLNGQTLTEYQEVPLFWSNQATARLQIAGLRQSDDTTCVTLGDPTTGKFSILCFNANGHLSAVESINSPGIHIAARKVLSCSEPLTVEEAQAPDFCLKAASKKLNQLITAA